jgi:hypothetical protein
MGRPASQSQSDGLGIGLGEYLLPPLATPWREADVASVGPFLYFGHRLLAPFDEVSVNSATNVATGSTR